MARTISFGGLTVIRPGGVTRLTTEAATVGLTATGVIGLIGEADGGEPGVVQIIDDPGLAKELFKSGPLADAVRLAFDPSSDPRVPAGAARVITYKVNQGTQSSVQIPGDGVFLAETTTAGSTTTVIKGTAVGVTVNQHAGRWLQIGSEKRRIVSNTATVMGVVDYTVNPGFTSPPGAMVAFSILQSQMLLTSVDYGSHTAQIYFSQEDGGASGTYNVTVANAEEIVTSDDIGGEQFLRIMYAAGPIAANGTGPITAATVSTVTVNVAAAPVLNAFAGMVLQLPNGLQRLISSNTAADPTVITLDAAHNLTVAEAAAIVGGTANVRDVTQANVSITGANGVATGLSSAILPTADNLSLTFSTIGTNLTLRQFVDYININTNYVASIPAGVNPDTTLTSSFDFGTRATNVDCRFDSEIDGNNKGSFKRDLQVIIDWINDNTDLVIASRIIVGATEGSEEPDSTSGFSTGTNVYLVGGTRGISANTDWQAGFTALLKKRMNSVVPLISQDLVNEGNGSTADFESVAAQLSDHIGLAGSSAKNEQGGYMGMDGTKSELLAQAAVFNDSDIHLFGQKATVLDVDGNLVEQPEWALAVLAAGMRAGAPEVGTPLTFKFVKVSGLSQDSSWDPADKTDGDQLLEGGVFFAEQTPNGTFRWVRDITTFLQNDTDDVFIDGNVKEEARFVAYDLRTSVEDKFTGLKAVPATVASVREYVSGVKMSEYKENNIITPSFDSEGVFWPDGFKSLRVFATGNALTIRIAIFLAEGIVFELNDITLLVPSLSA